MHEFEHLPTTVRAHRLERDTIIDTPEGKILARAGYWRLVGVNNKEYAIDHATFKASYRPKDGDGKEYYKLVTRDF